MIGNLEGRWCWGLGLELIQYTTLQYAAVPPSPYCAFLRTRALAPCVCFSNLGKQQAVEMKQAALGPCGLCNFQHRRLLCFRFLFVLIFPPSGYWGNSTGHVTKYLEIVWLLMPKKWSRSYSACCLLTRTTALTLKQVLRPLLIGGKLDRETSVLHFATG